MSGCFLRFYVIEGQRHKSRPVWEWLLQEANRLGVRGGSAFQAMAGFGRHKILHEAHFFELAGSLTIEVEFILADEEAKRLIQRVTEERIRVFYVQIPAIFGVINPDAKDPSGPEGAAASAPD